jgi:hypothetical protein
MRSIVIAAVVVWASLASAGLTPEQKCQDAIAGSARKYYDARYKALAKCRDGRAVTGTPADCSTDQAVLDAITKATTKLSDKVTAKCPGTFAADADLGLACKNALTVNDVVTCITEDVHGPNADLLIDTAYHTSGQIADPLLRKCQKTIGKALRKGTGARQKARAKCAKPIALVENPPTICPNEKALLALDKARTKLITIIETACSDTQVLDAALKFGGDCGDDRAGAPASALVRMTFERIPRRTTTRSRRRRASRAASPPLPRSRATPARRWTRCRI